MSFSTVDHAESSERRGSDRSQTAAVRSSVASMKSEASGASDSGANNPPGPPGSPPSPIQPQPASKEIKVRGLSGRFSVRSLSQTVIQGQRGGRLRVSSAPGAGFALENKSIVESGAGFSRVVIDLTCTDFIAMIRSERLATLPRKGGRWDRVLTRAKYFAEQLHNVDTAIRKFAVDGRAVDDLSYGHAWFLISLGSENSEALDKAFALFCRCSQSIHLLLNQSEALTATASVREQLRQMHADLLKLVADVAMRFYKATIRLPSYPVCFDVFEAFGETIEAFPTRRTKVTKTIWTHHIQREDHGQNKDPEVETLRKWLGVQDSALLVLNRDHSTFAHYEVEFTCLWFLSHLSNFVDSSDNLLLVSGEPGSGKTVLAASIADTLQLPLQLPLGPKTFSTLFFSISASIPSQATSLAVVKSLLYQLFDLSVGNIQVYAALAHAFEQSKRARDADAYEDHLWEALGTALEQPLGNANDLIIIVDGFDELGDGFDESGDRPKPSQYVLDKLYEITTRGKCVKLIALSQSQSLKMPPQAQGRKLAIAKDHINDDIRMVTQKALEGCVHLKTMKGSEQNDCMDHIVGAAQGSFLWAILACELLNLQGSQRDFRQCLDSLTSAQGSVQRIISKILPLLELKDEAKKLLCWLATAERPLKISEIESLFNPDAQPHTAPRRTEAIIKTLRPILFVHQHIVRFRHRDIQTSLQATTGRDQVLRPIEDRQMDLIIKSLDHLKKYLPANREPTLEDPTQTYVDQLFNQRDFLEYAVRYWVLHVRKCAKVGKSPTEVKEVRGLFIDTATLPLLEKFSWDAGYPTHQALQLHLFAEKQRVEVLGQKNRAVLQTLLTCALYYDMLSDRTKASEYYSRAAEISSEIMGVCHPLTVECGNCILRVTEGVEMTIEVEITGTDERTEYREKIQRKERAFELLIKAYVVQHGAESEIVIQMKITLWQFYIRINKTESAKKIHESIPGYKARSHEHLDVVISEKDQIIKPYKGLLFRETDTDGLVLDISQVTAKLSQAKMSSSTEVAEQIYVKLWQEVSTYCYGDRSIEWHQKNIEVMLQYSEFLKSQDEKEASAILTCLWLEYKSHYISFSESIVSQVVDTVKVMRSLNLYTLALSMLHSANSFYVDTRREESQLFTEIQREILTVSMEFVEQGLATFPLTDGSSSASVLMYRDVFLFMIGKVLLSVDCKPIDLAEKLASYYMNNRKWQEAARVLESTLQRAWDILWSGSVLDAALEEALLQGSVKLTERLAKCYIQQNQQKKAEDVYVELFRAVLRAQRVGDTLFGTVKSLLIGFYKKHEYHDKTISILQEILAAYRNFFGPSHDRTIDTLYELGSLCQARAGNHPYWIEYYRQVICQLNEGSDLCHPKAIQAVLIIADYYWENRRLAEAGAVISVLWSAFVGKADEYKEFKDDKVVKAIYDRYFPCLEETRVKWEVLHKVTAAYCKACQQKFNRTSTIALEATLALARVSQQNEKGIYTAIQLYEEVYEEASKSSLSLSMSTTELEQTLLLLYEQHIVSKPSANVPADTLMHATKLFGRRLSKARKEYGYSHDLTLSYLRGLSVLYSRQQKVDVAVDELITATIKIITEETSSLKMIKAAASIAETFHACNRVADCEELSRELYRKLYGTASASVSSFSRKLDKCSKLPPIFLAALRFYSVNRITNLTEVSDSIEVAVIHYENFIRKINDKNLNQVLLAAGRLRQVLDIKGQQYVVEALCDEVFILFINSVASWPALKSQDSRRTFILAIIKHMSCSKPEDLIHSVIFAANIQIKVLIEEKDFNSTYDIAACAFHFVCERGGFSLGNDKGHDRKLKSFLARLDKDKDKDDCLCKVLGEGFKLASLLVWLDGKTCSDEGLRMEMLRLSKEILTEIKNSCTSYNVIFARVRLQELNQLLILLGKQKDYETLEWLLTVLWRKRNVQPSWQPEVVLNIGRHLICARYQAGKSEEAVQLCKDIAYNLRCVHGLLHPATLDAYLLLSQLYTSIGQSSQEVAHRDEYFEQAFFIHEDILRSLTGGKLDAHHDDEFDPVTAVLTKKTFYPVSEQEEVRKKELVDKGAEANKHLRLLKSSYQRLGKWPKPLTEFKKLYADVDEKFGSQLHDVERIDRWQTGGYASRTTEISEGSFVEVDSWEIVSSNTTEGALDSDEEES